LTSEADLSRLLARIAGSDRAAFRILYDLTSAKLLGVALRIVRDRSMAEEVVQDAYLRIWQGAASYSEEAGRPMTWLISVARYRAIDVVRRRREVSAADLGETESDWLEGVPENRDREGEMLDADRLRGCLSQLDETQRRCFLLAYHEGYSREELAGRFERPVNTVKTWLHRTAAALRTCLDER
jgi:RNA polymerase sigma factor (sigma-70 family)